MELTLKIVRTAKDLQPLRKDWDRIAEKSGNSALHFDQQWEWLEHHGKHAEPWVVIITLDGAPVALCPWIIQKQKPGFFGRTLTWMGDRHAFADNLDILVLESHKNIVKKRLVSLLNETKEFDRFDFPALRRGTFASETVKSLRNTMTEKSANGTERVLGSQRTLRGRIWRQLYRIRRRIKFLPKAASSLWSFRKEDVIFFAPLSILGATLPKGKEEIRPLTASDIPVVAATFGKKTADDFERRMRTCWVVGALEGGTLVGYGWATDQPRPKEGAPPLVYEVAPPPGTVYFFDFYVRPESRSRGTGSRIRAVEVQEALRRGYRHVFLMHGSDNSSAIGLSMRFGLKEIGRLSYERFGPLKEVDLDALKHIQEHAGNGHQETIDPVISSHETDEEDRPRPIRMNAFEVLVILLFLGAAIAIVARIIINHSDLSPSITQTDDEDNE